jgi:hypothetical protein
MPFHQPDTIRYFTFESFDDAGVKHAVFTRRGGISPEPWASLNVGGLRGDDPQRVYQNRALAFETLDLKPESIYDVWQVHGADVICTAGSRRVNVPHRKADAIITASDEVTLFMRFGDCVPILLVDPIRSIIGIIHAGWVGTVKGVVREAIRTMQAEYCAKPANFLAAIGPSIARHHYPVGVEVVDSVRGAFGDDASALLTRDGDTTYFDLWEANRIQLEGAGVRKIENPEICTACHLEDWYSHRGEQGKTGRFGVLITVDKH